MHLKERERVLRDSTLVDTDWPMSLGYTVHLLTDNVDAVPRHHRGEGALRSFIAREFTLSHAGSSGYSVEFSDTQQYVILIMSTEGGVKVSDGRLVELIVHECSHIVDYVAEKTGCKLCTETRAYMLDWLVGKVCSLVLPHLFTLKLLGHNKR